MAYNLLWKKFFLKQSAIGGIKEVNNEFTFLYSFSETLLVPKAFQAQLFREI